MLHTSLCGIAHVLVTRLAPAKYIWLTWGRARVWVGTGCAVYCSSGHGWAFSQQTTIYLQRDSTILCISLVIKNSYFPQNLWEKSRPISKANCINMPPDSVVSHSNNSGHCCNTFLTANTWSTVLSPDTEGFNQRNDWFIMISPITQIVELQMNRRVVSSCTIMPLLRL